MDGYNVLQACRFTGCTTHQLRYWDQIKLVRPNVQQTGGRAGVRRLYSFRDLVALRVVKSLLDGGMSLQKVRRAYEYLRKKAALDEHLGEVRVVADGKSILVTSNDGEVLDALRQGQLSFVIAIDKVTRALEGSVAEFLRDREEFVETLRQAGDELMRERARIAR